jgi:hypothetical protein
MPGKFYRYKEHFVIVDNIEDIMKQPCLNVFYSDFNSCSSLNMREIIT